MKINEVLKYEVSDDLDANILFLGNNIVIETSFCQRLVTGREWYAQNIYNNAKL